MSAFTHPFYNRDIVSLILVKLYKHGPRSISLFAATHRLTWRVFHEMTLSDFAAKKADYITTNIPSEHNLYNYDMVRKRVRTYGLSRIPEQFRHDYETCLMIITKTPALACFAKCAIDATMAEQMVRCGISLNLIPKRIRTLDMCIRACKTAYVLPIISKQWRPLCVFAQTEYSLSILNILSDFPQLCDDRLRMYACEHAPVYLLPIIIRDSRLSLTPDMIKLAKDRYRVEYKKDL